MHSPMSILALVTVGIEPGKWCSVLQPCGALAMLIQTMLSRTIRPSR